jgi:hypothetical protein
MHELSVALDPEHWVSASGAPTLSFVDLKNHLLEYLDTRVFLSAYYICLTI